MKATRNFSLLALTALAVAAGLPSVARANLQLVPGTFNPGASVLDIATSPTRAYLVGFAGVSAVDSVAGQEDPTFKATVGFAPTWPGTNGRVTSVAVAGSKVIIGGLFTSVNGVPRRNLAALDARTGAVDPAFAPNPDNRVEALAVSGTRVYVGGYFSSIGGIPRSRLAAVNVNTGGVYRSVAQVNRGFTYRERGNCRRLSSGTNVKALALSGTRLYVGGQFSDLDGIERANLAAVNTVTGKGDRAFKNGQVNCNGEVSELVAAAPRVYVGGFIARIDGVNLHAYEGSKAVNIGRLAAVSTASGALYRAFHPPFVSASLSMTRRGTRLYVGSFDNLRALTLVTATTIRSYKIPAHPAPGNGTNIGAVAASPQRLFVGSSATPFFTIYSGSD